MQPLRAESSTGQPPRLRLDPVGYRGRLANQPTANVIRLMHMQVERLSAAGWDLLNLHWRDCARDVLAEREWVS